MAFLLRVCLESLAGQGWGTEEVGPMSEVSLRSLPSVQTHHAHRRTHPLSEPVTPASLMLPDRCAGPMAGHTIDCG